MHRNGRLTSKGREIMIGRLARGERPNNFARAMGVSLRTVGKWRERYRAEGRSGLQDRASRPANSPARTPDAIAALVVGLRRDRYVMDWFARKTGVSRATLARILRRQGLNRWREL